MKLPISLFVLALAAASIRGQDASHKTPVPYIRTSAEAVVSAKPDRAKVNIGVTTQAPAAQAAAAQNAKQLDGVIRQIRSALGSAVELKTIGYSVNPDYRYKEGAPPAIAGYTATNILEVTLDDLTLVGKLIDAATQSGANTVQGLQFTLKDESAVQGQALREAALKARTKAEAVAQALGLKITRVISAEESGGSVIRPMAPQMMARAQAASVPTPVESGSIEIHGNVTLTVEVAP